MEKHKDELFIEFEEECDDESKLLLGCSDMKNSYSSEDIDNCYQFVQEASHDLPEDMTDEGSESFEDSEEEGEPYSCATNSNNNTFKFLSNWYKYLIDSTSDMFTTEENVDHEIEEELAKLFSLLCKVLQCTLGIVSMVIIGSKYSQYLQVLHENQLWFSNIKEVEREISFRTEQGFYYSFYKELVQAPSFAQGMHHLKYDNQTEYGRTIDATSRFNLLPEISLSYLYRLLQPKTAPIFFYVNIIFYLQGLYLATLYLTAWYLSGSILSGILTSAVFVIHRIDVTRVNYTVPLRESFAIPFLFLQILLLSSIIQNNKFSIMKNLLNLVLMMMLLLTWQFVPLLLLCELISILLMARLGLLSSIQVYPTIISMAVSLASVSYIQDYPAMLISSPLLSCIVPAAMVCLLPKLHVKSTITRIVIAGLEILLLSLVTVIININTKKFMNIEVDSHIYQLLLSKLNYGDPQDFDSRLYMCSEAFDYINIDTLLRLSESGLMIVYSVAVICLFIYAVCAVKDRLQDVKSESYDSDSYCSVSVNLILVFGLSVIWGGLTLLILRLKALWLPCVCVIYGVVLSCDYLYKKLLHFMHIDINTLTIVITKSISVIAIISFFAFMFWNKIKSEIWPEELYEFWDPDTVQLMKWITAHTPNNAVFSGSMQLMAGVKLCTNRSITNHPHYENAWLRHRTKMVYQIYGNGNIEEIHTVLKNIGTSYIILEDSICNAKPPTNSNQRLCRLIDTVDIHNGHAPSDVMNDILPHLQSPPNPRFCLQETLAADPLKLFTLVLRNKTFRVYRVAR